MNRHMLGRKCRECQHCGPQKHYTPVEHDETSAVCEGTEIRLTELRNFGCKSSMEKFPIANIYVYTERR
jgi:hypothetical protein